MPTGGRSGIKKSKRYKLPFHPDEVRRKIQAIKIVHALQDHIFGTVDKDGIRNADLTPSQVTAALGLLRKCVPDLINTAITADLNVRYVAELPKVLTREEWVAKYGRNHLDLTPASLPPAQAGAGKLAAGTQERQRFGAMKLTVERLELAEANAFVREHHRHHRPVVGHVFSIGASLNGKIVGIAIVGRPVSRHRDDGVTAEVTRLATDGTRNACSFLYGASARAAFALGFKRIGTYILATEPGTSLTATGWRLISGSPGGSWSVPSRPRIDKHPLQAKLLYETCST